MVTLVKIDKMRTAYQVFHLAVIACAVAFYLIDFFPIYGIKLFYVAGYLIIFIGLITFRTLASPKRNKLLFFSILALSLSILLWEIKYHQVGMFTNVYDSYRRTGKILLFSAILIFLLSNYKMNIPFNIIIIFLIIGGFAVNLFALYQAYYLQQERVALAFDRATIAAYIMTVVDILMSYAILCIKKKSRFFFFCFSVIVCFSAIICTETRVAILTYPFLVMLLLFLHPKVKRADLCRFLLSGVVIVVVSVVFFHNKLENIAERAYSDLHLLTQQDSETSVGARLAMWVTGLQAGLAASPWGNSAEERAQNIHQQIAQSHVLSGAAKYLNVHMHNEVIESFSLRGIAGAFIVIFFYFSLLYSAQRNQDILLFIITLSMIVYGMTDVILFSTEATIVYALAIILSQVLLCQRAVECE